MNKNLLAIAITAALAVPTMASAEVKIIGQAQLELVNSTGDTAEGITLDDSAEGRNLGSGNASAIGITGSHDLGNGLTGLYKINFNFHADDGDNEKNTGTLGARDQFIGLKGGFGTVLAGRINTPYKTSTVKWDPFLATFMQARGSNGMSGGAGGVGHNSYADEVIAYANTFGSVKFVGAVALDESVDTSGDITGDHIVTFSVNVPVGPVELAVGYLDATGADDGTSVKVGVKWTSGDLTLAGQYENLGEDLFTTGEQSNILVTASMSLGDGASVSASFGSQTDESDTDGTAVGVDGTYTAIGYKKAMSKKVSWHAGVVVVDEGVVGENQDVTRVGAGVRVKF